MQNNQQELKKYEPKGFCKGYYDATGEVLPYGKLETIYDNEMDITIFIRKNGKAMQVNYGGAGYFNHNEVYNFLRSK